MKILIIDDEKLTREGLISSIDWTGLNIEEIYVADDGINGIKEAKLHKPDIILSDVRMPRMNGIDMCKELLSILPYSSIIFMSGYSDKEYLKAAIKLKAVSYVEKPIDTAEIEAAIKNAITLQKEHAKNQVTISTHNKFMQNKLSLEIIYTPLKRTVADYLKQFQDINIPVKANTEFTTLIITLKTSFSSISEYELEEIYSYLEAIVKKHNMNYIFSIKNDEYIICHLFANNTLAYHLNGICNELSVYFSKKYQHYLTVGKTVHGIQNVYQSYNSAVLLIQCSFFYDYNSIITEEETPALPINFDNICYLEFEEGLKFNDIDKVYGAIDKFYTSLKNNQKQLPNYPKDFYYKLLILLQDTALTHHLSTFSNYSSTILDNISSCPSLTELNQMLQSKVEAYFSALQKDNKEHATIFAMKEFIRKNYPNENLSVKDISENVYLSSTYVCTLFKNETGITINQYLTEYRIEKAKSMLKDHRYKITEISAKVGYNDGNYFGKAFKKLVGLSPSEYRERYGK